VDPSTCVQPGTRLGRRRGHLAANILSRWLRNGGDSTLTRAEWRRVMPRESSSQTQLSQWSEYDH
jgi:hypothetical protein